MRHFEPMGEEFLDWAENNFQKIITFLSINFDRQSYNTLNSRF